MPSADQIKALLSSHADQDEERFYSVAMQIAAHEARSGRGRVAKDLRALIDAAKASPARPTNGPIPLAKPRGELADVLSVSYPNAKLLDMVLSNSIRDQLVRVTKEYSAVEKLRQYGLAPRRKLLLVGKPGTGKTYTAAALAGELGLPLFVVRLDGLLMKFMGQTAAKLRLVFDALNQTRGVYLFDEFDSIGSARGRHNDVGEMHRVVNSFLQMVEEDQSDSLILAATNHCDMLDHALFRRFDDVIDYQLPDKTLIIEVLKLSLVGFKTFRIQWAKAAAIAQGLSYADISIACQNAIKEALIENREQVKNADLTRSIRERKTAVARVEIA